MQENKTFEAILEHLLDGARAAFPELDTREGSLIHSALAPAALEVSRLHTALAFALEMSYADTASRAYLIRRAAERAIAPHPATAAVIEAEFEPENTQVHMGRRFRVNSVVYIMSGRNEAGRPLFTAESPGTVGNLTGGRLVPVEFVTGLRSASIRALVVPGRDEEDTETFRARYLESQRAQGFGGNIAAYREKVRAMPGIGGVRVFPNQNGPGTVGVGILAADYGPPSQALVAEVKETLDPENESGDGRGWAPIGHRVTVTGATARDIEVTAELTLAPSADLTAVETQVQTAIQAYFLELAAAWDRGETLIVRASRVATRILDIPGVLDVADTTLNGEMGNLWLGEMQVPRLGALAVRQGRV